MVAKKKAVRKKVAKVLGRTVTGFRKTLYRVSCGSTKTPAKVREIKAVVIGKTTYVPLSAVPKYIREDIKETPKAAIQVGMKQHQKWLNNAQEEVCILSRDIRRLRAL